MANWLSNQPDIKMPPLISVVIPCYNNETFLEASIASALHQTYSNVEVIVIDDGSTDRSQEILRACGDKIRWETQPNQGAPVARNRGVELANGEYIKFLDADDLLLPDCLERQIAQALQLSPDRKAIVYGDALRIDRSGQALPSYALSPRQPDQDPIAHILAQCPLTSCPLHRRDYLLEIGGFDPSLPRSQEHDLHLRLVLSGVEFVHYPGAVYQYREYQDGDRISNRAYSKKGAMLHYNILQKHQKLIEAQTGQPLTSEVRKLLSQRLWAYGRGILREGCHTEAQQYFTTARQLDAKHCITGNPPYPTLVKLFGPRWAESLMQQARRLLPPATA